MTDKEIIKEIDKLVSKINNISQENHLALIVNTYERGSIEKGNFTTINIKVYKEL